jgi:hypothetical protein
MIRLPKTPEGREWRWQSIRRRNPDCAHSAHPCRPQSIYPPSRWRDCPDVESVRIGASGDGNAGFHVCSLSRDASRSSIPAAVAAADDRAPCRTRMFWDLFGGLNGMAIQIDAVTYPIARWGVERATAKGVRATVFRKHDAGALRANLSRETSAGRPVVVTDGFCPLTGRPAPLRDYAKIVRAFGGLLVVDDTQGFGIFGRRPFDTAGFGDGRGHCVRWRVVGWSIGTGDRFIRIGPDPDPGRIGPSAWPGRRHGDCPIAAQSHLRLP